MANKIHSYAYAPGADIYYDSGFQRVLEINLPMIKNHHTTTVQNTPRDGNGKYVGDLHLCLAAMGVAPELWWTTMRLNGYTNPVQYGDDRFSLLIPSSEVLNNIRQKHITRYSRPA